jgi:hypothetical protein
MRVVNIILICTLHLEIKWLMYPTAESSIYLFETFVAYQISEHASLLRHLYVYSLLIEKEHQFLE